MAQARTKKKVLVKREARSFLFYGENLAAAIFYDFSSIDRLPYDS